MTATLPDRAVIDVSKLPDVAFGRRSLSWWASMGFISIEGTTMAVVLSSYLYLRTNAQEWPPRPIMSPDLFYPTINLLLLLASVWPAHRLKKSAKMMDRHKVQYWLLVLVILSFLINALRGFEFTTLNIDWNVNAYGSALWGVYVAHTFLMIAAFLEVSVIWFFYYTHRNTRRHLSDVEDTADYQYFLTAAWVLSYAIVVIGPRIY